MGGAIIVTGASRGIGAATAKLAAANGYSICINYNSHPDDALAVQAAIELAGGKAMVFKADMASEQEIVAMFKACDEQLGQLAGLVNNAGFLGGESRVDAFSPADMQRLWDVNVVACFTCAREAILRMSTGRGGKGGAIVNVSSMAADSGGMANRVHYATTKGAINTFTRGLAKQVGKEGIRVNAVMPGAIDTHFNDAFDNEGRNKRFVPNIPLGRVGDGDDVARAIVWLLTEPSSYVSGECLRVNGGMF